MTPVFSLIEVVKGEGSPPRPESDGAEPLPLPCLNTNNSTKDSLPVFDFLRGGHLKTAFCLTEEIRALAARYGIERLGFLTLTFADHVLEIKEASRRFNSLNTHVLKARYECAIATVERQKSGRLHFHLVVVLKADIRSGCDFGAFLQGDYRSAGPALRAEWAFWRGTAKKFRFGRTELLPIRSTSDGIAKYVGKYIAKHMCRRVLEDKGARLVRYLGFDGSRRTSCRFVWNSKGSAKWRVAVAEYAHLVHAVDLEDLKLKRGKRWAWKLAKRIALRVRVEVTVTKFIDDKMLMKSTHVIDGQWVVWDSVKHAVVTVVKGESWEKAAMNFYSFYRGWCKDWIIINGVKFQPEIQSLLVFKFGPESGAAYASAMARLKEKPEVVL